MNLFTLSKQLLSTKKNQTLRPIVRITLMGMQLGIIVMVLAFAITAGYKKELQEKLAAMGSDIKISTLQQNYSFESEPFKRDQPFLSELTHHPDVENIQYVATKIGVLKTEDQVAGVICKGIDSTFNSNTFQPLLIEGKMPNVAAEKTSNEILISRTMAQKLSLTLGDKVSAYFVQDPPRQRRFTISGIYNTYMPEFDNAYVFIDLEHVQRLNNWDSTMISAIEIGLKSDANLEEFAEALYYNVGYELKTETLPTLYPHVYSWFQLFDTNVYILLIITIIICIITMISTFFIIILEHVKTVGIFKTLGFTNQAVFKIFLFTALRLILKGLLYGNIIAIVLGFIQILCKIITLNPDIYYVSAVPLYFNWGQVILLNIAVLLICLLAVAAPAWFIAKKISPITAIRYD